MQETGCRMEAGRRREGGGCRMLDAALSLNCLTFDRNGWPFSFDTSRFYLCFGCEEQDQWSLN